MQTSSQGKRPQTSGGSPISCAIPSLGILTCRAETETTILSLFGVCDGYLAMFGSCANFDAGCGATCELYSELHYGVNEPSGTTTSTTTTPGQVQRTTLPAAGVVPSIPFSHGSCSVTVMLYLTSSITYMPYGYVGLLGAGASTVTEALGGIGGGGPYGCTPIICTIGFQWISQQCRAGKKSSLSVLKVLEPPP